MQDLQVRMPQDRISRLTLGNSAAPDIHSFSKDSPIAVDLFCGAGGLSFGMGMAGIWTVMGVERHPHAAETFARNHSQSATIVGNIESVPSTDLLARTSDAAGRGIVPGDIDCIIGGPPCQGFSCAGEKQIDDPRNGLFVHFVRIVNDLRPKLFLFENVATLTSMYKGAIFNRILEAFSSLRGYRVSFELLDAHRFGVPSMRRRLIMVGSQSSVPFEFPEPTHGQPSLFQTDVKPFVTVRNAISDLDFLTSPGESSTVYHLPPRGEYQHWARQCATELCNHESTRHSDRVAKAFSYVLIGKGAECIPTELRSKKDGLLRLDPNSVSRAVLSAPEDLIHYSRNRIPTVREQARLQSFPDHFVFFGQRTAGNQNRKLNYCSQTQQVGNAVPPLLGRALGNAIRVHLGV